MSAPTHLVFTPLHTSGPVHAAVPSNVDLDDVVADVAQNGVSAPAADIPALVDVVAEARERGIDLSVIVLDANPSRDTDLRDLATTVGESESGTILVMSPDWMGSSSDSISRVQLETAQDRSFGDSSAAIADRFSHEIVQPGPPWALYTVLLVAIVAVFAAITFVVKWRRSPEPVEINQVNEPSEQTFGHAGSA
ncbi:DUF6676 family protein [Rhodococcus sp. KBS0724]|jgi:hypothetical protein|uniref:Rv1476 family membrane protein n=1 Tax=Rhodococcus sp. KBS0724 TaxID=1179674 RepID=UPI0021B0CBE5|nr:DUF6676 family protein [Rhodococcus sp. KBS0724]